MTRYYIERHNRISAYLQLYAMLRDDIVNGAYRFGGRLPSKRLLAEDAEVSVITVAHAYDLLVDEGYAEAREKSGFYVSYREADFLGQEKTHELRTDEEKCRSIEETQAMHEVGELPYHIFSKTMRRVLLEYGEKIMETTPGQGLLCLREELARYLARAMGIEVSPAQIVVGAGAEYLYGLVTQLLDDCRSVAIERPCYGKIRQVYEREGLTVEELDMGTDGIVSDQLWGSRASILHVTPFHSYPSKVSADISKKNEYLKWAGSGRYIVEDNYDGELTVSRKMEATIFSLALSESVKSENVIYINTFSRTLSPSLRVGYMVLSEQLSEKFEQELGFYACSVPTFEQYLLYELIRGGEFERHVNRVRRKIRGMLENEKNQEDA